MKLQARLVVLVFLVACKPATPVPAPAPASASAPDAGVGDAGAETARAARPARVGKTRLAVMNDSTANTVVYVSFGADSAVTKADWKFCAGSALSCSFPLSKKTSQEMPNPAGKYLNATFSFGGPVGCGTTKGEVNINNPSWYDVLDVSLVDGYSNKIKIQIERLVPAAAVGADGPPAVVTLGPPNGKTGNEKVFGLFPYGCDICVARENPPCGISKGKDGCKSGGQYDPSVICQWQGATKGGGESLVKVVLL